MTKSSKPLLYDRNFWKRGLKLIDEGFVCSLCGRNRGSEIGETTRGKIRRCDVRVVLTDGQLEMRCTICVPPPREKKLRKHRDTLTMELFGD